MAVVLAFTAAVIGVSQRTSARNALEGELRRLAQAEVATLEAYFDRAASIALVTARNAAFSEFYRLPGDRDDRLQAGGPVVDEANAALAYLEVLYPDSIGEVCFIDAGGAENARVVRGQRADPVNLSPDESGNPFFHPTLALAPGQVHQSLPYESPDTLEWVISNSTPIPTTADAAGAMVHFEVTVESFRARASRLAGTHEVVVVDIDSGDVIFSTGTPQAMGAPLGVPGDRRFAGLVDRPGSDVVDGRPVVWDHLEGSEGNVSRWAVAVVSATPLPSGIGALPALLALLALVAGAVGIRGMRRSERALRAAASTDGLTGLANRRQLELDLHDLMRSGAASLLVLSDLNGFKQYNDTFGHGAGDALLVRLGTRLREAVQGLGTAYRLGGDEFVVIAGVDAVDPETVLATVDQALWKQGEGFSISASSGALMIPDEAREPTDALRLADERMYRQKLAGRVAVDTSHAGPEIGTRS